MYGGERVSAEIALYPGGRVSGAACAPLRDETDKEAKEDQIRPDGWLSQGKVSEGDLARSLIRGPRVH
jgi:hypothetical protein